MHHRSAIRERPVLGAFLIAIAVVASSYAVVVAIMEGLGSAVPLILAATVLDVNCIRFLTGRVFPPQD